jgi:NAD(P)-dependent dehydrogenase (short-subunit alcohol dehydrogenase family)
MGGEAIANGDSVSDFAGAERLIRSAIDDFGDLHVVINNAGILRDRMLSNMTEEEWDAVINVHLKGTFATSRHAVGYWRAKGQGRASRERAHHQHHVGVRHLRQSRPDELRGGQGRHRRLHQHPGARGRPLRRHRQRRRPDRADRA